MNPTVDASAVSVTIEDPCSDAALCLIRNLSTELGERYGDDGAGAFSPDDVRSPDGAFAVAWLGEQPVGCGALRPLERGVGEVKRMFVEPGARRRGVARKILEKLGEIAGELGYTALRLETGVKQPEAIGLYESAGYRRVRCYGRYANNPLSVCFEKWLDR